MVIPESPEIVLSICIPTYNRINKTFDLVKSLLLYEGNDIEVIVLDNCSEDFTENTLTSIKDRRFFYTRNDFNIGSMPNVLKSMTLGTGKFIMLCLDKDFILVDNLSLFIKKLKAYEGVSVGYCSLNYNSFNEDISFNKGLISLLNLAYTSEHPSGIFVRRNILESEGIINKILKKNKTFPFSTEILKAEMCYFGNSKRINIPLVYTEKLEDCKKVMSHTYTGDNIYFLPGNIEKTFVVYVENLLNLNISKREKTIVIKRVFSSLFISSTYGFKEIMKNKSICAHHGINTKTVTQREIFTSAYNFSKLFLLHDSQVSFLNKIDIWVYANLKLIYIVIRAKLSKAN